MTTLLLAAISRQVAQEHVTGSGSILTQDHFGGELARNARHDGPGWVPAPVMTARAPAVR